MTKPPEEERKNSFSGGCFYRDILCFAKSDMIADGNRDIKTCGFSDILFTLQARKANKTAQVSLRTLGHSLMVTLN